MSHAECNAGLLTVRVACSTTFVIMGPWAGGVVFGTGTIESEARSLMENGQMVAMACCYTIRVLQVTLTF